MNYIAYYRVSTQKQGRSGLGLDAQKEIINNFLSPNDRLLEQFTEIESGSSNQRPKLLEALNQCTILNATLIVAKLDRLSRELHFITLIEKSGIDFLCADMPEANSLTIHIFGAVAQHEREMISQRTKAALQQAKLNGTLLGAHNPKILSALNKAKATGKNHPQAIQADQFAKSLEPTLLPLLKANLSQRKIVTILNECNVPTARGKRWSLQQLQRTLKRINKEAA